MSRGLILVGLLWLGSCVALILMFRQACRIGESRDCMYTVHWRTKNCVERAFRGTIQYQDDRLIVEDGTGLIVEVDLVDIIEVL